MVKIVAVEVTRGNLGRGTERDQSGSAEIRR